MEQDQEKSANNKASQKKWLKRLGIAGFLFFLAKGLVWVALIVSAWKGCK